MVAVTLVKFLLMLYCRSFKNEIVKAYAQDHFFDVITNSLGLAAALLAQAFEWWIDPVGAILVTLYLLSWQIPQTTFLQIVESLLNEMSKPS